MPRYHYHRYNHQASNGMTLMFIGALIGSPFIFWFGFFEYATAPMMTVAATGSSALFSLSTLGIGALILYGSIGLAYLYSAASECFNTEKNALDVLKSRFLDNDWRSVKGVINSIASVLWSPFLLLGGLSGMAVKATVNLFSRKKSSSDSDETQTKDTNSDSPDNQKPQNSKENKNGSNIIHSLTGHKGAPEPLPKPEKNSKETEGLDTNDTNTLPPPEKSAHKEKSPLVRSESSDSLAAKKKEVPYGEGHLSKVGLVFSTAKPQYDKKDGVQDEQLTAKCT